MPIKKEREYRALAAPLTAQSATKLIQTEYYVEGYATTFDAPYLLYEFEDGTKIYERIDAHALDGADMSDVIMQYDHEGRVFARQSNKTLILPPDYKGLKVAADLGKTDLARAGKLDTARLLYIAVVLLRYREREAWRKTPYQITTLFKYHKEYNPHIFRQKQAGTPAATENMDDIDIALGGF